MAPMSPEHKGACVKTVVINWDNFPRGHLTMSGNVLVHTSGGGNATGI